MLASRSEPRISTRLAGSGWKRPLGEWVATWAETRAVYAGGRLRLLLLRWRHIGELQLFLHYPPSLQRALGYRRPDAFQRQLAFRRFVVVAVEAVAIEKRVNGFLETDYIGGRLGSQCPKRNENRRAHHSTISISS